MILKRLGKVDSSSLSFLTQQEAINHVNVMSIGVSKDSYLRKLKIKDPQLQDILESMLEFNPYFRPSAKELLNHPYFDSLLQSEFESYHPKKVVFRFDTHEGFDLDEMDFKVQFSELNSYLVEKVGKLMQGPKLQKKKN